MLAAGICILTHGPTKTPLHSAGILDAKCGLYMFIQKYNVYMYNETWAEWIALMGSHGPAMGKWDAKARLSDCMERQEARQWRTSLNRP